MANIKSPCVKKYASTKTDVQFTIHAANYHIGYIFAYLLS